MGLTESKVSAFVSSKSTSEYNKSLEEESQELFLKNGEICETELVDRKCNDICSDNQGNNSMKKQTVSWKTVGATNKPSKTYYLVDDSFECTPLSSLNNDSKVFSDNNHNNQPKKHLPISQLVKPPLVSKISLTNMNTCNMDLSNNKCQVLTTNLTKTPHCSQTFPANSKKIFCYQVLKTCMKTF
ncbi:hypothetical protein Smp_198900 [Schistosoma mansoni]|uniref:hypothetical protein n=1 Tax=Schistosoma mansoni TaxID=6183 RepID=UPI00022C8500|nr:hypothetical protein Smp_198900 [Schistosoma mansoni]|eukprot:XP_018646496.1 hypothetical protein Smp_198900 [Schistosoma mansoni]